MHPHQRLYGVVTEPVLFSGPGIIESSAEAALAPPPRSKTTIRLPVPARQTDQSKQTIQIRRISIIGEQPLANRALHPAVVELTNETVTLYSLRVTTHCISQIHHRHEYALDRAYPSVGTIKKGRPRIALNEPNYDHVSTNGRAYFNNVQALQILGLYKNQRTSRSTMQRSLIALNRYPSLFVNGTLLSSDPWQRLSLEAHGSITGDRGQAMPNTRRIQQGKVDRSLKRQQPATVRQIDTANAEEQQEMKIGNPYLCHMACRVYATIKTDPFSRRRLDWATNHIRHPLQTMKRGLDRMAIQKSAWLCQIRIHATHWTGVRMNTFKYCNFSETLRYQCNCQAIVQN